MLHLTEEQLNAIQKRLGAKKIEREPKEEKPKLAIKVKPVKTPKVLKPHRKYYNQPTEVDGIVFASKKEAGRYIELKQMQAAGLIKDLELQPKFECVINGQKCFAYRGDFRYWNIPNNCSVTEDAKGFATAIYKLKRKIVRAVFGVEIQEV
jgi:hypothetical protein